MINRLRNTSLSSRIALAFFAFGVLTIGLLGGLAIWANEELESALIDDNIENEATYYTEIFSQSELYTGKSGSFTAWLKRNDGIGNQDLPESLTKLTPGMHEDFHKLGAEVDVYVTDTDLGRLYLLLDGELVEQREQEFLYMLTAFSVILIIASFFLGGILAKLLIRPVTRLQKDLAEFRAGEENQRLPEDYGISELALVSRTINQYQERVDSFIQREQNLTSMISHELRNPLAIIGGSADVLMLRHDTGSADWAPIDRIKRSSKLMAENIDALLTLARESELALSGEQCDVAAGVDHALASIEAAALAKKIELTRTISDGLSLPVPKSLFAMLMSNLLHNAVKHTDSGTISIVADTHQITVTDTGCGIPKNELRLVTQARKRGSNTSGNGFGLGLYIVQQICERVGWALDIDSEFGVGTIVTITLSNNLERATRRPV